MVLKYEHISRALLILLASLLAMSSAAPTAAEGYDPDEFLNLDLSKAVLSPRPLGPANTFGKVSARVRADSDVAGPRHGTKQAGASSSQSAGRPGHGYADPGLAVQIRRHLQVETVVTRPS